VATDHVSLLEQAEMTEDRRPPTIGEKLDVAAGTLRRSWLAISHDPNDMAGGKMLAQKETSLALEAIRAFLREFSTDPIFSHDIGMTSQRVLAIWQSLIDAVESHEFHAVFAPYQKYFQDSAEFVKQAPIDQFAGALDGFCANLGSESRPPSGTVETAYENLQFSIGLVTRQIQDEAIAFEQAKRAETRFCEAERQFSMLLDDVALFGGYLGLRLLLKTSMGNLANLAELILRLLLVVDAQRQPQGQEASDGKA
jgi:hypothetical protein